jgi:hypothetical protein
MLTQIGLLFIFKKTQHFKLQILQMLYKLDKSE